MGLPLHFGIEEEYFLTDLQSRQMLAEPSVELLHECRSIIGEAFAFEMFQGQIEVASPVFSATGEAADYLAGIRGRLSEALAQEGIGLLCAGSHPLARWRDQQPTPLPHFQQLFEAFQSVARRSVLSGLHVHVEIPQGIDRIAVMNEVAPWLPMLLMLSCSSPFWQRENSGFMSYRQVVCDGWPRMGTPEYFVDEADYRNHLCLLQRIGTIEKGGNGWWGIRPASRYPTLELRMTDACPRLRDTILLATMFRVMVAHAVNLPRPGAEFDVTRRRLLKENRWQAKRYGTGGKFVLDERGEVMSAAQWLDLARLTFEATARGMGESQLFDQVDALLLEGNSASRQLACLAQAGASSDAVQQVVDLLLAQTRSS
ncbi:carboxylate-amine ligase [Pseudomonas syringae]|nr:carboxylate-amine ligase [Pseudomonas syringae]MCF5069127.1 carboxylate-amine ligase [Pseudomonas syringae]